MLLLCWLQRVQSHYPDSVDPYINRDLLDDSVSSFVQNRALIVASRVAYIVWIENQYKYATRSRERGVKSRFYHFWDIGTVIIIIIIMYIFVCHFSIQDRAHGPFTVRKYTHNAVVFCLFVFLTQCSLIWYWNQACSLKDKKGFLVSWNTKVKWRTYNYSDGSPLNCP